MPRTAAVRRAWLAAAVAVAVLLAGATASFAQGADAIDAAGERFARWDTLRDPDFAFNPDERAVLGFSVRSSPGARAALDGVEQALAAGDTAAAARGLTELLRRHGDEVLQVAGRSGRWVGVGEWALYLLGTRIAPEQRAGLAGPDAAAAIADALAWRDVPRLRALGLGFEGLPEGGAALAAASRLLAERGARDMAASAAARALQTVADPALAAWVARQPAPPAVAEPPLQLPEQLRAQWRREFVVAHLGGNNPFAQWPTSGEAPIAPIVPVVADGVIYLADSVSVSAWELLSGRLLWHHAGPLEVVARGGAAGRWFDFGKYVDGWRKRAVSPYQVSEPAVSGNLVVACVQAVEASRELHTFDNIPINWPLPVRHLVALERSTGRRLWTQTRPLGGAAITPAVDEALDGAAEGDDFLARFSVTGPPVISGGIVYAAGTLTEGAINSYLAAFDAGTGELLWRTFLCAGQQDLTMFNRPFQEHTAAPPLVAGGAVYLSSNLGIVASVDAWSGRVRWLTGYTSTARMASRSPESDKRRDIPWVNRPPVIEGGLLVLAPLDSRQVLALDPATGRIAYGLESSAPRLRDTRHEVLGTGTGQLLLASDQHVECVDAATGQPLWTAGLDLSRDDSISGALELSGRTLLVPTQVRGLGVVDLDAPLDVTWRPWDDLTSRQGVRRVVAAGAALLLTDNTGLWAAVDAEAVLAAALAADTPEALLGAGELLLSLGRLTEAEARFESLLSGSDAALAARARTGRLEVGLRRAKLEDTPARWEALLALGQRVGDPWSVAPLALVALDELHAEEALARWTAALAAEDPSRRLDLGALTPAGPLPAGLLAAQLALPGDAPAAAVARLQDMLQRWPDERWKGGRVRDEAARRIAALLDEHGRGPYAEFERQAELLLALTDDAGSLQAAELRFPNALAVARARAAQLRTRLDEGHAFEVFEHLAADAGARDDALAGLRAEAADALGEAGFARLLRGEAPEAAAERLPALPPGSCERTTIELTTRGSVSFPGSHLALDEPYAGSVVCAVNGPGELLLLDAAAGSARWRRPLPGRAGYLSPGAVLTDGARLFVQVSPGRVNGVLPPELVEAVSLADGSVEWSRELPGEDRGSVVSGGLLLRLHRDTDAGGAQRFRLSGWGCASGAHALQIDLPDCESARLYTAGPYAIVFLAGELMRDGSARDVLLAVADLRQGLLGEGASPPGDSPVVLESLADPPLLLLTTRTDDGSVDATLSAFDPASGAISWSSGPLGGLLPRQKLFVGGARRMVLLSDAPASPGVAGRLSRLTPVDALEGVLPPTDAGLPLAPLPGQSSGLSPWIVTSVTGDNAKLVVADATTATLLYSVRLPGSPGANSRVLHGRDGFVLLTDRSSGAAAALRVFDGATGAERYSTAIDDLVASSRPDVTLVDGAVLLASGGRVTLIRSPTR